MPGWPAISFMLIFVLLLSEVAGAQAYKWTDENGMVHYGDTPPTGDHPEYNFRTFNEIQSLDNGQARVNAGDPQPGPSQQKGGAGSQDGGEKLALEEEAREKGLRCQKYRDQISNIDSRLRAGGYSASLGNRLRADRRRLQSQLAWECLRS